MKRYKLKKKTLLTIFSVLFVVLLFLGIFLLLSIEDDSSDSLTIEPDEDCMVSDTACEEMELLSSCPENSVCREMLVGWASGDINCPTYTVICYEEVE